MRAEELRKLDTVYRLIRDGFADKAQRITNSGLIDEYTKIVTGIMNAADENACSDLHLYSGQFITNVYGDGRPGRVDGYIVFAYGEINSDKSACAENIIVNGENVLLVILNTSIVKDTNLIGALVKISSNMIGSRAYNVDGDDGYYLDNGDTIISAYLAAITFGYNKISIDNICDYVIANTVVILNIANDMLDYAAKDRLPNSVDLYSSMIRIGKTMKEEE